MINSYNDDCSICMEDFNLHTINLKCNHTFHSECIIKYIETEIKRMSKESSSIVICCNKFICPLCRSPISCEDVNNMSHSKYKYYNQLYKQCKKEINNLQNESYLFSIKLSIRKIFTNITPQEAYKYLMKDEDILESICNKKTKLRELKELKEFYNKIYYRNCICMTNSFKTYI